MYGEIIIGINMIFNYAILSFANKVAEAQAPKRRLLIAALSGAVLVTLLPSSLPIIFFSFLIMTYIAFGTDKGIWRNASAVVLIGAFFAGGLLTVTGQMTFGNNGSYHLLISALFAYFSLLLLKSKWLDVRKAKHLSSYRVHSALIIWNKEILLPAFIDTGNDCHEPMTGKPVHFVSYEAVESAVPDSLKDSLLSFDPKGMPDLSAFPEQFQSAIRLVRLKTVSGWSWAAGFPYDQWTVDGVRLPDGFIVLTKEKSRYPQGTEAILHVSVLQSLTNERGSVHVA